MGRFVCGICGWTYSEESGCPEMGIAPGTPWDSVPGDFECPDCSAPRSEFVLPRSRVVVCTMCGFRLDESKGSEKAGLPAGFVWEDVDPEFKCPVCGCAKNIFKVLREAHF